MPGYGIIFPDGYQEGQKLPVEVFLHGIGEISSKKTLQQAVDFHFWFKAAADKKKMIYILPQDDGTSLFDDKELLQILPVIQKYSVDGMFTLSGLSRGAGTCLSIAGSSSIVNQYVSGMVVICPPTWSGMDKAKMAAQPYSIWWFHGAKDVADVATSISRAVSTVDAIRKAGKKNFYFSVYPDGDHYIWTKVMNVFGTPPINPTTGAKEWIIKDTAGNILHQVTCVNNPACDVYDFMLSQHKGVYPALPLLGSVEAPAPAPAPTPTPTPTTTAPVFIKDINWAVDSKFFVINWRDGKDPMKITSTLTKPIKNVYDRFVKTKQDPEGHIIITIEYKNDLAPLTFERKP